MKEVPISYRNKETNQWTGFYIIGTSFMKELKFNQSILLGQNNP